MASKRKAESEKYDTKKVCVDQEVDNKGLFVRELVKNELYKEAELARWATQMFELTHTPSRLVSGTMFRYGFAGLDSLLCGAARINKQDLVQEIVKHACAEVKELKQTMLGLTAENEIIYAKLAELPNLPPVGLEFPNVDRLCSLCSVMPSILATKTGMLFFNELVGKVEELYLFGNTLSTMKDINHPRCLQCTSDADAMLGTTKFVVLERGSTKFVVALRPGQQVDKKAELDFKIHKVVVNIDGPFDDSRSKSPKLQASFDGKHLLWVHNKADQNVPCFEVINGETLQATSVHAYYSSARSVWWAGKDTLGVRVGSEDAWQSINLSDISKAPQRLARSFRGTSGAVNNNVVVGLQQHNDQVLLSRLDTRAPQGSCGALEVVITYPRTTSYSYSLPKRVLDVIPHPTECGFYINVKSSNKELTTFYCYGSSKHMHPATKAKMLQQCFHKVWPLV